jgi:hypothetical protein
LNRITPEELQNDAGFMRQYNNYLEQVIKEDPD